MPELPEVETVKRGLTKLIVGKKIIDVTFDWPKSFPNTEADVKGFLLNSSVNNIARRGKVLLIKLDSLYTLVIHLKMTGQLVYVGDERFGAGHPSDNMITKLPDKSTRVIFTFSEKDRLFFNDQRKFGWVRLIPTSQVKSIDLFKKLGPEPLSKIFTFERFSERLEHRKNSSIKSVLLDQTVIAGIGNIYADESLWLAKIHPESKVSELTNAKRKLLYLAIREILNSAIKAKGSTDRNYRDAEGRRGSYLKTAKVFRREGLNCPRCSHSISKIKVAGRGTHICNFCQRKPKKGMK
jgi:formamidopyrimidine-DNA glycosylase